MPWKPRSAPTHTRKAGTKSLKKLWSAVANSVMAKTHDDGRAVRAANNAVKRRALKRRK